METEWNKMLSGKIYDALDPLLLERLSATRAKIWEFNNIHPSETENLQVKLRDILGACGNRIHVNQPFRCDYGCNIYVGENFFANFNLTILDEAEVHIGNNVFIGPNVSIFTACHPVDAALRNTGVEWAEPVSIGNNVWIGGDVTILPGVRIGNNVVIGAGAVVVRDVPDNVVAAGNPAGVIRHIEDDVECEKSGKD